jgi:Domain of unknown function (DUF4129)
VSRLAETCPLLLKDGILPLLLCLAALASPAVFGQTPSPSGLALQQSLSLREYISQLERCSAVLAHVESDPSALHSLRLSLPTNWVVRAGDQSFTVSTDWLTDDLSEIEGHPHQSSGTLAQLRQRLAAYRKAAQALNAPPAPPGIEQSRARLNGILAAKEFRAVQAPSWLNVQRARLFRWIALQWEKIFSRFGLSRSIGNLIAWIVIALAALLILLWTARAFLRGGSGAEMLLREAAAVGRNWQYWLREARSAAARSDYRSAIHAAYWAAVVHLEETKTLTEDRSRTPRESLRLLRRDSTEYAPLSRLTRRFELVWYGYRPATEADWSDAVQQLETLGCLRPSTAAIFAS